MAATKKPAPKQPPAGSKKPPAAPPAPAPAATPPTADPTPQTPAAPASPQARRPRDESWYQAKLAAERAKNKTLRLQVKSGGAAARSSTAGTQDVKVITPPAAKPTKGPQLKIKQTRDPQRRRTLRLW